MLDPCKIVYLNDKLTNHRNRESMTIPHRTMKRNHKPRTTKKNRVRSVHTSGGLGFG